MGRIGAAMPGFCLNRIRPMVRIRSPVNILQSKNHSESASKTSEEEEKKNDRNFEEAAEKKLAAAGGGRKIMVVVDTSPEAKNAIQWALTHTIQSHDLLILLYVTKVSNSSDGDDHESKKEMSPRVSKFLSCMKTMCQQKRPEIKIEVCEARGKEKGPTIVEEAKRQEVALLVLGQKKRFTTTWRLIMMWASRGQNSNNNNTKKSAASIGCGGGGGVVEYCIQNAGCMAIAVRRKSKKVGGYLITTKRQKDFWLLA